jgi:DNA repair exonuclease SbcCD nuclease subunit
VLRFIHTADWQIGRVFSQFEEDDAEALAAERFAVIERIAAQATQWQADAVLVAGDVFDAQGIRDKTIHRMFLAMAGFTGPWVMISGNHDAALAESVWARARRLGAVPANVTLALAPEPVILEGKCAILPAPLTQRHTYNDLTDWFGQAQTPAGLPRIGLAHGSVQGVLAEDIDATNPIAADRVQSGRLDYLAMGDWHGMRCIDERCWYSGTPEQDRFRDNDAGHALLVEITAAGARPQVQPWRSGNYRWVSLDLALHGESDADQALNAIEALGAEHVAQVSVSGTVDLLGHERLRQASRLAGARTRALLWDDTALRLEPTDEDLAALRADGYVGETLRQLREAQLAADAGQAELARGALLELARILEAGRGRDEAPQAVQPAREA